MQLKFSTALIRSINKLLKELDLGRNKKKKKVEPIQKINSLLQVLI